MRHPVVEATPTSYVDLRATAVWSTRPLMTRAPLLAALVAVLVLAPACSKDASDPPDARAPQGSPTSQVSSEPPAPQLETRATIRTVTGGLSQGARAALKARITETVDGWFDAAYLGGDYPRTDFDDAFAAFTPGARQRAVADRKLMSNAAVGTTTYQVRALARRVIIDVLAEGGRASAVTVAFRLGMARAGDTGAERRERVAGHLYLTYAPGDGWQVFGFDVQRGAIA